MTPPAAAPRSAGQPPAGSTPPRPAAPAGTTGPGAGAGVPPRPPATPPARATPPAQPGRPPVPPAGAPPARPTGAPTAPTGAGRPPVPPARPAPQAQAQAPASRPPVEPAGPPRPAPRPSDEPVDDYEEGLSRWAGLLSTLGVALVAVVAAQVVASILQGLSLPERIDANSVETDLFHRLGFPFGNLGPVTALLLVAGLVLMSLPRLLGLNASGLQERLISVMLLVAVVLAIVIALGSLLAVRNSLHEYTARGADPPTYVRIGFASFLFGTLGTAAVALFGSLAAINARRRTR